ncbi:unnamed protein product [Phytophthora fragariaefolia]|uniref:Unnamed protein product n=1 Tax=Phytophthora fragariaefolia TaxID=1490495 RepID=A0A9W7CYB4_9STRA|nr:unnamed protein product [Phytophthora fragariaefolia]
MLTEATTQKPRRASRDTWTIAGDAVAWAARRQTIKAQSTAEAEYVAACEAVMEGRGIINTLDEARHEINTKTYLRLGVDNTAAIVLAN